MLNSGVLHQRTKRSEAADELSSHRMSVWLVRPSKSPAAIKRRAPSGRLNSQRACSTRRLRRFTLLLVEFGIDRSAHQKAGSVKEYVAAAKHNRFETVEARQRRIERCECGDCSVCEAGAKGMRVTKRLVASVERRLPCPLLVLASFDDCGSCVLARMGVVEWEGHEFAEEHGLKTSIFGVAAYALSEAIAFLTLLPSPL